jgi:hypothetical protein
MFVDVLPDPAIVHDIVSVDDDISERDDLLVVADLRDDVEVMASEPIHGLTNYREVSFDQLLCSSILHKRVECGVCRIFGDKSCRGEDVP